MNGSDRGIAYSGGRAREFPMSESDFHSIRELAYRLTGIKLSAQKRELVYGRLARRVRANGLANFNEYYRLVARGGQDGEIEEFCNAITTNLTAFFREDHHFEYLRSHFFPRVGRDPGRPVRIWSAGCSTGEEPYSIAMCVDEYLPDWRERDLRILATDLDSAVLARARAAIYHSDRLRPVSAARRERFFTRRGNAADSEFAFDPVLAKLVTFNRLNLLHDLPVRGPFDVIFCRNVIIYFDKDTQRLLFEKIARVQRPGDLLFLGHSESMFKVSERYSLVGKTIYRRNES
jgi:chemotaxis protein methyltransferase CheR